MAKKKKLEEEEEEEEEKPSRPSDHEAVERRRLRSLAFSNKLLCRGGAPPKPSFPLAPSPALAKLRGRDVVKRGQRKCRFLFSLPGHLAPLPGGGGGGRIGELAHLATRNPVLYLEFPQGRMKLFGTHVYPKNKYLTLQLTRSAKGVMCEDIFESLIVFSEAWWIGSKEENPEELRLEFPKNFNDGKPVADSDFKGGAGATSEEASGGSNLGKDKVEPLSPDTDLNDTPEDSDHRAEKSTKDVGEAVSVRQSARTAGKNVKFSYAESSSGDDSITSDTEVAEVSAEKVNRRNNSATTRSNLEKAKDFDKATTDLLTSDDAIVNKESVSTEKVEPSSSSLKPSGENLSNKKERLVQATLSTLFEKAADKGSKSGAKGSPGNKGLAGKRPRESRKQTAKQSQVRDYQLAKGAAKGESQSGRKKKGTGTPRKQNSQVADDEVEDISSASQDDSDEDWAA
ncbi:DNA-binding protein RHL1 isoform X2 [Ananas comosus]|uniref:DNA-binding protein RHL1 isoform X2 n=1 Tax=Ananas comosus TaxID=4615 RepID=A0A6P5GYF9_ANACO|nr:DNA-binding protein RHL1 isoform X2 [Ananas comosus]